jgi:hypothetical protein
LDLACRAVGYITLTPLKGESLALFDEAFLEKVPASFSEPGHVLGYFPQCALHLAVAPSQRTVEVRLPDFSIMVLPASGLRGEETVSALGTGRGMFLERGPAARTELAAIAETMMSVDRRRVFMRFFAALA